MDNLLFFPVGTDNHGRTKYEGIEFKTLAELETFQRNVKFAGAAIISNGTLYDAAEVAQAIADK